MRLLKIKFAQQLALQRKYRTREIETLHKK